MSSEFEVYNEDLFEGHFINNSSEIVNDTLLGIIASNPKVGILNCGNVIVCRNYANENIVKVISGGPSGHEPFQAGFVGKGMLSAAVQGEIFHSPYVSMILKAIKEISYNLTAGVLVIVQNNISDCLKFGLAVERARNQGITIEMLVVNDDFCVINKHQGKRGMSGIVLITKIAGAMAERLLSLKTIYQFCQKVLENMTSISFSLRMCSRVDECVCTTQHNSFEIEIGTGLHGEKGLLVLDEINTKEVASFLITQLSNGFPINDTVPVVILVNNLGQSLLLEEMTFVKEVTNCLQECHKVNVARAFRGKFLTSPKIKGFSLTILNIFDDLVLKYLDDSCEATGWGYMSTIPIERNLFPILCRSIKRKQVTSLGPRLTPQQCNAVYYALQFASDALISCEKQLNIIDSDGKRDIGTKMKRGAVIVLELMKNRRIDFSHPKCWFAVLSHIAERFVGGAVGSFYSILFEVASTYFGDLSEDLYIDFQVWLKCFEEAIIIIKRYGRTEFGFGTMYDPLFACLQTLNMFPEQNKCMESFRLSLKYVEDAVFQTKRDSRKHVDPGAEVVRIWLQAIYEGLSLRYN
ncbi:hypothetical protein RI129_004236 [Pyrocoelia pectoralis]|uniref:Triokinase/FMN cyclase n=1 Tax=Pyrocoelia pectoralis TaxID=417401 RepID=A0AAN7ZKC9_9COLE